MEPVSVRKEKKVRVGDRAPDFTLPDQTGKPVQLRDLLGRGTVVLYFYPKDETPGCTLEARAFRDSYDRFTARGAEVVGISSDSVAAHRRFAARHGLPFLLLSDRGASVRELYGVEQTLAPRSESKRNGSPWRSEEHTSELQSPVHFVCRLLLVNKNDNHWMVR